MKRILVIVFCLLIITGCNNKEPEIENTKEKYSEFTKVVDKFTCDINIQDVKEISKSSNLLILNNGDLYAWTTNLYSDNTNCRKIETDIKFKRFINGMVISDDNKIYFYNSEDYSVKEDRPYGYTGGFDYSVFDKNNDIFIFNRSTFGTSYDYTGSTYYAYVIDNKVHLIDGISGEENNIFNLSNDEIIINHSENTIKTNKSYYHYGLINKDECEKYDDIKCEYGLVKIKTPTDYYDYLIMYTNSYYIFKDSESLYTK